MIRDFLKKTQKPRTISWSFAILPEVKARVEVIAKKEGTSASKIVSASIQEGLRQLENES